MKLDAIDRTILSTLQDNGRTTNVELAKHAGLAPSSMLERVRRLEERGVIQGYRAILDPAALDYHVQAMVMLSLDHPLVENIDDIDARIRAVPEVKSCFLLAGTYDFAVHVVVRDIDHLSNFLKNKLSDITKKKTQETYLILSPIRESNGYSTQCRTDEKE